MKEVDNFLHRAAEPPIFVELTNNKIDDRTVLGGKLRMERLTHCVGQARHGATRDNSVVARRMVGGHVNSSSCPLVRGPVQRAQHTALSVSISDTERAENDAR